MLWTRPDLTETKFQPQTVSLDLSNYDGVIVEFETGVLAKVAKGGIGGVGKVSGGVATARSITNVDDNGVTFTTGCSGSFSAPEYIKPNYIWGYK